MYTHRLLSELGSKAELLRFEDGEKKDTYLSAMIKLEEAEGIIQEGSVQWIWESRYRKGHKRKNWFISVESFEEAKETEYALSDFKYEALRSSGPGGQNVNKVETAIRVIHAPTGFNIVAREERSQYLNKKLGLSRILKMIASQKEQAMQSKSTDVWMQHNLLVRGNPIRVYWGDDFILKVSH